MHGNLLTMASKRKRTASGQYSRAKPEREFPPTQVRRLRDAAMRGLRDPEWATELGRLYLEAQITAAMYAAGRRWAEMAAKYQGTIGIFPIRSSAAEPGIRSLSPDPDSPAGRKIVERERNAIEKFFEAHAVLVSAGVLVESTVRRLCEHNEAICNLDELAKARTGLMRLVAHWGLTGTGKQA
jgi:hypothetical protein